MNDRPHLSHRVFHALVAVALVGTVAAVQMATAPAASAATMPPVVASGNNHVTVDGLPTVQINGVVYDQAIVGNTVYAVGQFTSARPAGSPLGVNETPRSNMLAYNLTTGELIQSFNPVFNGTLLKTVTPSPDGSRLYVGGLFNNVSGSTKYSLVALNTATGSVIQNFTPNLSYMVNDVVATDTTVYVGGAFTLAGPGQTASRPRLAAFSASDGALLSWAPSANDEVHAMVMSPKGDRLFVGGAFTTINGQPSAGLAALDPQTGAKLPWPVDSVVHDYGSGAGILTLSTDGTSIFGGGWAWGQNEGNLEGVFSANPDTGAINWIEDCHGDTYSAAPINGYIYTAGHPHYCGNLGGYPQTKNWNDNLHHSLSYTTDARGTLKREQWGYFNFEGYPAPSLVQWFPNWSNGNFTSSGQATWSVTGNSQYVVYGGEFPRVNNIPQQGLVRFAVRPIAPAKDRPWLVDANYPIRLQSNVAGQVRLTVPANYDRDSRVLNYRITRDGTTIHQMTQASAFWDQPIVSYIDKGLTPGQSYAYRVWVTDEDGNASASPTQSVTVSGSGTASAYSDQVLADGAQLHWRLGSSSGGQTPDAIFNRDGTVGNVSFGAAGAVPGDTAATFSNSSSSNIYEATLRNLENELTVEAWVRTNTNSGGRIAGFTANQTGTSGSYDRMLYMHNDGSVSFGAYTRIEGVGPYAPSTARTVDSQSGLNNNQWHHVVGTLGADGMSLYIDGVRVSTRVDTTGGQAYYGYFRVGAGSLSGWPGRPSNDNLSGQIDEAAVYHKVLAPDQIARHYELSGRTPAVTPTPGDSYGAAIHNADPYLYYRLDEASGSTAKDSGIRAIDGDYNGSVTRNQSGAVPGNASARFGGSAFVASRTPVMSPGNYSVETWFNTNTTTGGELIGFGDSRTGNSGRADRQVYMRNDGRLTFTAGTAAVVSDASYNNGGWHHVVATQGQNGMLLFVDGTQVGANPNKVGASYTGYWRVGGDTTPADSTSNGFNGRLDEAAVYTSELTSTEVLQHFTLGGGTIPNVAPTASFTVGGSFLHATFDGSGSSDPDGTITDYSWDFGDGTTGSGVNPSHTYATAGTYTVTLTVTDNDGGVGHKSLPIQVQAQPQNVPPTASFTSHVTDLSATFDGSGSSDPDGTITDYSWNFGDGTTGSGVNPSHTYATAGTYTVTLTVTDNESATDTVDAAVVATAPTGAVVYARDTFERSVIGGFGNADTGGAWSTSGSSSWYSVSGGTGKNLLNVPGRMTTSALPSVSATDVTFGVDLSFDKAPTGGGIYTTVAVRQVGNNEYHFKVRSLPNKTELYIERTVNGVNTTIGATSIPLVYAPGDTLRVELEASGTSPTTLTGKVWNVTDAAPAQPNVTVTDSTSALQGPGGIGVYNFLSGSATNAPINAMLDNLLASTGGVVEPPNVAPTASFTKQVTDLHATFDGSGSSDPDGTITDYSWDFGDGTSGSGVNPSHTYATAGTYTVTLTVTDNDLATGHTSQQVTVAVNQPNQTPTASFTSHVTDLSATFDGSGSSDPDGTITDYSWDFGDGTSGSGVNPSHTYASAGTYTVTLTVTDNESATDTADAAVVATAPTGGVVYARDTFERSVIDGFGNADTGGAWSTSGSSSWYSVSGGTGKYLLNAPGRFTSSALPSVSATDVTFGVDLSFDKAPTGGGIYTTVAVRQVGNNEYHFKVRLLSNKTELYIERTVNGVNTTIGATSIPLVYAPGDTLRVEFRASGTSPTTLTGKVWNVTDAVPAQPNVTVTDSTSALQGPGGIGAYNYLSGSATNAPINAIFDNLIAREQA